MTQFFQQVSCSNISGARIKAASHVHSYFGRTLSLSLSGLSFNVGMHQAIKGQDVKRCDDQQLARSLSPETFRHQLRENEMQGRSALLPCIEDDAPQVSN